MDPLDVARSLAHAARELDAVRDVDDVLTTIVEVAASSLPGVDHAGVSLVHRGGRIETRAGTADLVWELDALQYDLGDGPCLSAIRDDPAGVVTVNHLPHEQRWPRYVPEAARLGVRAQMGLRLFTGDRVHGGLNLYTTLTDEIDDTVELTAQLLATHAALALGHARREAGLSAALASRERIGRAVGILMQRYGTSPDAAFAFLTRVSQTSNVKLRDLADRIAEGWDPVVEASDTSEPPAVRGECRART